MVISHAQASSTPTCQAQSRIYGCLHSTYLSRPGQDDKESNNIVEDRDNTFTGWQLRSTDPKSASFKILQDKENFYQF